MKYWHGVVSMSATTVTSTERRSSVQIHDPSTSLNGPAKKSMAAIQESFPVLEDRISHQHDWDAQSPIEINPVEMKDASGRWQPRRESHVAWDSMPARGQSRHKSRKSISEALDSFRTRRGSVSANARELGDALKAPISWKLIVCHLPP